MLDPKLLEILRCPLTGQRVRLASVEELRAFSKDLEAGLITEDGSKLYAVRGDIPVMLPGEVIQKELV